MCLVRVETESEVLCGPVLEIVLVDIGTNTVFHALSRVEVCSLCPVSLSYYVYDLASTPTFFSQGTHVRSTPLHTIQ